MAPRIAIFGTGAMGSLLCARLQATGEADVVVTGTWRTALERIAELGITLEQETIDSVSVTAMTRDGLVESGAAFDYALVAVKSFQTPAVAEAVRCILASDGLVITFQNGIGNRECLAAEVGTERVVVGASAAAATLVAPGHVRFGGDGGTWLAPAAGMFDDPRVARVVHLLRRARFTVDLHDDADAMLWGKVAVNCAINPLTALAGVPNGALLETAARRALVAAVAAEVESVARAQGIHVVDDSSARALVVARATRGNTSSMLQDVRAGRPTEIEALSGAVARAATRYGVEAPLNRALTAAIRDLEATNVVNPQIIDHFADRVAA